MKSPLVISLGGSVIIPEQKVNLRFLRTFRTLVLQVARKRRVIIVTGGGGVNRTFLAAARSLGHISDTDADWIGIAATRLNAELIRSLFGTKAYERVLGNPKVHVATLKRILIGAGWEPGHSSDTDAVLLAKTYGAKEIVNISNIPFVFDKDPKKHRDAKPLRKLSWKLYRKLITGRWSPRLSTPFDPVASKLAQQFRMTVHIMSGDTLAPLTAFVKGKSYRGTTIHSS